MDIENVLRSPPQAPGIVSNTLWKFRRLAMALLIRLGLLRLGRAVPQNGPSSDISGKRERVVVAGGGWAGISFIKLLDPYKYEVVWISPSSSFSFTPLLPSVCGGMLPASTSSVHLRSLLMFGNDAHACGHFYQAFVEHVNWFDRTLKCRSSVSGSNKSWEESFDYLVLAVGSEVNTFNTQGVKEYAFFLRNARDALAVRARVAACLEAAAQPGTSEEERRQLLTFVVVGAGPTGVESAAEIKDFLNTEAKTLYPDISHLCRVVIIESGDTPLKTYSKKVQREALATFQMSGVEFVPHTRVVEVTGDSVIIQSNVAPSEADGQSVSTTETIPCGMALWAAGVQPTRLASTIAKGLSAQNIPNRLLVDQSFRVLGADGVFAIGDCSTVSPPLLEQHAKQLFEIAISSQTYNKTCFNWLLANRKRLASVFPQLHETKHNLQGFTEDRSLTVAQFKELLESVDRNYRPPAATAQNAKQEGEFLALVFNSLLGRFTQTEMLPAFVEQFNGALCFLGHGRAALELPFGTFVGGRAAVLFWKFVYLQLQLSRRAVWRCVEGWIQTAVYGRSLPSC